MNLKKKKIFQSFHKILFRKVAISKKPPTYVNKYYIIIFFIIYIFLKDFYTYLIKL